MSGAPPRACAQKAVASSGRGILAIDESNATCGKRLDSIGVANTEDNRRAYRELLLTTPGVGQYISGAILFEETLFQNASTGKSFIQVMNEQGIIPGIKVDKVCPLWRGAALEVTCSHCIFTLNGRDWCRCRAATTSPGARAWTAWPPAARSTTSRALASPSGTQACLASRSLNAPVRAPPRLCGRSACHADS